MGTHHPRVRNAWTVRFGLLQMLPLSPKADAEHTLPDPNLIPYEQSNNTITPITIHVTTRQQIRFRLKAGRFITNV